jgi:Sec-independent protein secretion pathway component TatC
MWPLARSDPDPFVRYLAGGVALALIGFTIGALGPSSSMSFAPMWVLYGLGLAVLSWARLAQRERALEAARPGDEGQDTPSGEEKDVRP